MDEPSEPTNWTKFKAWCGKNIICWKIIGAFLLSLLFCILISWALSKWGKDLMGPKPCNVSDATEEINAWLYFLSGAGTAVLATIAYVKIGDINKQNQASFLLYIDERWGSPEVLKAREIKNTLYRETQEEYKELLELLPEKGEDFQDNEAQRRPKEFVDRLYEENHEKFKELNNPEIKAKDEFLQAVMGIKILKISYNTTMTSNFIYLLNFLDFMDTIGCLAKDKNEEFMNELDDLCGDSLIFNFKIFQPYIFYKRQKHESRKTNKKKKRKFYYNFEKLYKKLDNKW